MKFITTKPINTLRTIASGLALAACIGGFASIAASAATKAKDVKADVVYRNGFVYTVDSVRSRAQAFAVKDGKFIAVGSNDDMKPFTGKNTKTVNLKGKMVMPSLIDTHIHALRGALTALGLAFPVTASVDDIKAAVKKYIADKKLKKGDWVEGAKWGLPATIRSPPRCWTISRPTTRCCCTIGPTTSRGSTLRRSKPPTSPRTRRTRWAGSSTGTAQAIRPAWFHDKALGMVTAHDASSPRTMSWQERGNLDFRQAQ